MRLRAASLAVLVLVLARHSVSAQCTTSNGRSAPYSTVRVSFNPTGMPAAVQQGISDGISAWNGSSCNDGDDFPVFVASGAGDATIQVAFVLGISQTRDGLGNSVCAEINHGMATDGSDSSITLYGTIRFADGQTFDCYPTDAIAEDTVAHELGHYLGLDESGCNSYIMAARGSTISNGQLVWDTSRQVQAAECGFADAMNETPVENNNETGGDPFCDAYCWTSCQNGVCPARPDGGPDAGCPILVDLEGDGIHLTGLDDPVWFDIDTDGAPDLMSWTDRGEGLLALDRDGNGTIDDGGELFGNYTRLSDGSQALNGYLALAELDTWTWGGNVDGQIDSSDAAFTSLWLWTDVNHDGISQLEELKTLVEAGIQRIGLNYKRSNRADRYGNEFRFLGRAWKQGRNGVVRPIVTWDVFFLVVP